MPLMPQIPEEPASPTTPGVVSIVEVEGMYTDLPLLLTQARAGAAPHQSKHYRVDSTQSEHHTGTPPSLDVMPSAIEYRASRGKPQLSIRKIVQDDIVPPNASAEHVLPFTRQGFMSFAKRLWNDESTRTSTTEIRTSSASHSSTSSGHEDLEDMYPFACSISPVPPHSSGVSSRRTLTATKSRSFSRFSWQLSRINQADDWFTRWFIDW